ncbi:hypothetical protein [Flavobacterium sp. MDT1-60]|uniref:hypothetical protein n=1 Tax=Flavobacterium sp. MDT1-60 TaxID=1979344 RepID=UPI00177C9DEA|nr:hypothetical protein [Flavobacterium sp. MDT1-60]QOG04813.1 hypothetical protein IHE43_11735 [Flavobacterium sp. MDT1-60]
MKIYLRLVLLLTCLHISAQEDTTGIRIDTVYNNLLNKTPKGFRINEASKPKNRYFEFNMNSIGGLETIYGFQKELKLNAIEINWLNEQIDQIALAFYLEGKPILIRAVGGYDGCPDENIYTEKIKASNVTILNFCFTCTDSRKLDDFISVFNNRTNSLLR